MRVAIGSDHAGFRKSLGDLGGCLGGRDAATSVCHQLNSVPSIHMRFRMTAILRDGGFGLSSPKAFSAEHFGTRVGSTPAASKR